MRRGVGLLIGGAALLALSGLLRGASAAPVEFEAPEAGDADPPVSPESLPETFSDVWIDVPIYMPHFENDPGAASLAALLRLIRIAEHYPATIAAGNEYRTFYGNTLFHNFADHPAITGEKRGVRLPDEMCINAGLSPGCVSTAAGAYQITRPTWKDFRRAGGWGPYLSDFSPASQDEAARRILLADGAIMALEGGDVEAAIRIAGKRWASLPGSTAQQRPKSIEWALATFNDGLNRG